MGVLEDRIAITGESHEQAFDRYMRMRWSHGWMDAVTEVSDIAKEINA